MFYLGSCYVLGNEESSDWQLCVHRHNRVYSHIPFRAFLVKAEREPPRLTNKTELANDTNVCISDIWFLCSSALESILNIWSLYGFRVLLGRESIWFLNLEVTPLPLRPSLNGAFLAFNLMTNRARSRASACGAKKGRSHLETFFCVGEVTEVWQVAPHHLAVASARQKRVSVTDGTVRQQSRPFAVWTKPVKDFCKVSLWQHWSLKDGILYTQLF